MAKLTVIIGQVLTWWKEMEAKQGEMVYADPVLEKKGIDQRWNFFAKGTDVRTRLVGEHRAAIGFRGPVLRSRDEGEIDDFSDGPDLLIKGGQAEDGGDVEIHGGASDTAPGLLYMRSGMDPDDDDDYPTGGHIFAHAAVGDAYSADGNLHLGAGVTSESFPYSASGHIWCNAPVLIEPCTFAVLATIAPYSGMEANITDSPTNTFGTPVTVGGGSYYARVHYIDQWYCIWGISL